MKPEALWEAYHEHVRRFVNHKTNFHPDAEDIVQNGNIIDYRVVLKEPTKLR